MHTSYSTYSVKQLKIPSDKIFYSMQAQHNYKPKFKHSFIHSLRKRFVLTAVRVSEVVPLHLFLWACIWIALRRDILAYCPPSHDLSWESMFPECSGCLCAKSYADVQCLVQTGSVGVPATDQLLLCSSLSQTG